MNANLMAAAALTAVACSALGDGRKNELPSEARTVLEKAEQFELISLNPRRESDDKDKKAADKFHGWMILGQTALKDAETRKKVLASLSKGIEENDGSVAACFNPRHGLRATHGKKTVELVICFECFQIEVYVDGKKTSVLTSESPQPVLDKILSEAKVPLPPKREK